MSNEVLKNNNKSLLIEILCEEIPSSAQIKAVESFSGLIYDYFLKENINIHKDQIEYYVSNRRMSFIVNSLFDTYTTDSTIKIGPKVNSNQNAIDGFLKSNRLNNINQLQIITQNQQDYYSINLETKTILTKEAIAKALNNIFPKAVAIWPKTMNWQDSAGNNWQWIRPVRNLCIIFDKEIINFQYFGITSNNKSINLNRYPIDINSSYSYQEILRQAEITIDHRERKKIIKNQLQEIAKINNLDLIDHENSFLVDEVVGMCENPNSLIGEIPEEFLSLPTELLVKTLKNNQKYFCLANKDGSLSQKFIFVNDISSIAFNNKINCQKIIKDHQKLVRARLNDAMFFVNEDLKIPLIERYQNLHNIIFHQKIGSVFEKTTRIYQLAKFIAIFIPSSDLHNLKITCELAKNDLGTKMVAEMPELQGKIGSFYAKKQGYEQEISTAIYEHYLPLSANDQELPRTAIGTTIAIADKIDSIVSLFVIGEKPTSSKDPFALRRSALSIIRICLDQKLALPFNNLINKALNLHLKTLKQQAKLNNQDVINLKTNLNEEILSFFSERLKFYLKDQLNYRTDIVNIVISNVKKLSKAEKSIFDINKIFNKISFVQEILNNEETRKIFVIAKRISNILESNSKKSITDENLGKISRFLLKNTIEKTIYKKLKQHKKSFNKSLEQQNWQNVLAILNIFVEDFENFFDNIFINDQDEKIRNNRIQILLNFQAMIIGFIDYHKIEI